MHVLTPHRKGAGYFVNNQALGARDKQEGDVQQCSHCDRVIILQQAKDDGAYCSRCQHLVCGPCADRMEFRGCEPMIKKIEQAFNLGEKLAQFRKLAGLEAASAPRDHQPKIFVGG